MATFTDDFNRPDTTDLGPGWVEVSGDWSITSGQLSPGAAGGTIILRAAAPMDSPDHYAQATIAATTAASHGVWCRGNTNISSGYLWRNDGTSWGLFSVVGGSFTLIGTWAAPAAPGDVARVQAVGSTITGWVNGVQRVSVANTAVPTGVSVGIRTESTAAIRFDDFAGADVSTAVLLGAAAEIGTARPLAGRKTATLTASATTEAARPLGGRKTATLGVAVETDTAHPLGAPDLVDVDLTIGAPHSPWTAGTPHGSGWEVAAPS
ncbi:hypothetical protein [Streptomyces chumphonensis]|uniref:hypothetical protein n=1 Tax=Streptomyces chumphonensis TaxID=1214925 RepID=UPI003D719361